MTLAGTAVATPPPVLPSAAPAAPRELAEVEERLNDLARGDEAALSELRLALHRVVATATFSGAVKTLAVQALLLLDDPRIAGKRRGGAAHGPHGGAALRSKIRKLIESAVAAHTSSAVAHDDVRIGPSNAAAVGQGPRLAFTPDALLAPDTDRALVEEFVVEARAQLEIAEAALLTLDGNPDDMRAVDSMFRALHTIKGTSAFLGVEHATELAHHAESLLTRVRSGVTTCSGDVSNLLFRSIDMLDAILVAIESVAEGDLATLPDGYRPLLAVLRDGSLVDAGGADRGRVRRVSGPLLQPVARDSVVRVRSQDLERLSGVVGELVLTHGMIARDAGLRTAANQELARKIAHAERLARELEEVASALRAVPLAATVQKAVRLARDVALESGKSIELTTEGDDTLVERAQIDALGESLLHMVRNAIDHGIEAAEDRLRAGKPRAGRLRIVARRVEGERGTQLVVELSDDGRGLDARRIVGAAVDRGLISPDAVLTDEQAFALALRPGLSTAPVATELSGRGVGLDVVRTNIEALGGTIVIASEPGRGATFTIRLPVKPLHGRQR